MATDVIFHIKDYVSLNNALLSRMEGICRGVRGEYYSRIQKTGAGSMKRDLSGIFEACNVVKKFP